MVFEYQARLKCLQGAADILFTGENRYLSEPSLFPYEFLVVLRLVQLVRLREPHVPPFIVDLQDLLEQLTGQRSSFIFSDTREDIELAGAEYPWRTGLAQLNTFRVSQVPLRRSDVKRFPRTCPLDIVRGLSTILKEYADLNMWEDEADDAAARQSRSKDTSQLEALAVRRSVLLALVFNHLCYFHPKMVTLEDSPNGLSLRLGISIDLLSAAADVLSKDPLAGCSAAEILQCSELPENCAVFQSSSVGTIIVLVMTVNESKLAFMVMKDTWTLWANSVKDNAQVLTECSHIQKYVAFDGHASGLQSSGTV